MPTSVVSPPPAGPPVRPALDLKAAARALGAAGGGAGAAHLLSLLCNPDVQTDAVRRCLRGEPALSARVLKVANSPFYRQAGQVGTVDRAVQLLGLSAIRGIAAAGCLDRAAPARAGNAFDPDRFRQHCLAMACAAQQLSRATGAGIDSEAFIAGLLHDIGVMLLAKAAPAAMASFVPPVDEAETDSLAYERHHFGADHVTCVGVMIEAWGLPAWLHAALTQHHAPVPGAPIAGLDAMPALLALADRLASRAGFALWPAVDGPALADPAPPQGLAAGELERIVAELPDAVAAMSAR